MPTWIRVKDNVTGDEYDVERSALRSGMTPIEGYPENSGPDARPRPAKPLVGKDGQPPQVAADTAPTDPPAGAKPRAAKTTSTPAEPADNTKEN